MGKTASMISDEELLRRHLSGEHSCLTELMRRHKDSLLNFIYRFLGNYDDAVDVAQETFIRVHRFGHTFQGEVRFSTWLYSIAANLSRTELKRYRKKFGTSLASVFGGVNDEDSWDIPDETYRPDERVDSSRIAQEVQKALMAVQPTFREVVIMRDIQHLSYDEIAAITGLELGTVKSRINRGRAQLQQRLSNLYNELFGEPEATE